jgi:hypothetical protein
MAVPLSSISLVWRARSHRSRIGNLLSEGGEYALGCAGPPEVAPLLAEKGSSKEALLGLGSLSV